MTEPTEAARFLALFGGSSRSHGTYGSTEQDGHKVEIKQSARTLYRGATEQDWQDHLDGKRPLGIPLLREDNTVVAAALDLDSNGTTPPVHSDLAEQLAALNYPAFVTKSKSGDAHIYFFFKEPILMSSIRAKLRAIAEKLGWGSAEIYPRTDTHPKEDDAFVAWINMPYFGDSRYCVTDNGRGLSRKIFLAAAEESRMEPAQFLGKPVYRDFPEIAHNGPPCLEAIATAGGPPGGQFRNKTAVNFAKFAKEQWAEDWEVHFREYCNAFLHPNLPEDELKGIIKRWGRKDYNYLCKEAPICDLCNVSLCRTRAHGVSDGEGGRAEEIKSLTILRTIPPLCRVELADHDQPIEMRMADLLDAARFRLTVITTTMKYIRLYSQGVWNNTVKELLERAKMIDVADDTGPYHRCRELLEQFVVQRNSESIDDVIVGLSHRRQDQTGDHCIFTKTAFLQFLDHAKFAPVPPAELDSWVVQRLHEASGTPRQTKVKKRNMRTWWVPADQFDWETVEGDLPDLGESPI